MVELGLYLVSVGMIVIGALGMIRALSIPGKTRMILACAAAAVPIGTGIWLFCSSGLRVGDLDRLVRASREDVQQTVRALKEAQSFRGGLEDLLER